MTKLPNFFEINLDNYTEQLTNKLDVYREIIKKLVTQTNHTWNSLMLPLEEMDDELHQLWSPVSHMHSVVNNEKLREVYKQCIAALSTYHTELGQNEALYQAIQTVEPENDIQKKILEDELLGFKLSGVALPAVKKARYAEIQSRLSTLSTEFETNLLDATNAWKKLLPDESCLKGLPQHALNTARALGEAEGGYVLTLDYPCFHAVLTYAEDESLRKEMYEAFTTRASDIGPHAKQFDNGQIIAEMLALRHEKAQLLGFANYAELSLATKMAPSTAKVMDFLVELAHKSKPQAQHEFASLEQFAKKTLKPWDIAYYSEKQQQAEYAISQEELRPYFPETKVLQGMFTIVTKLYGIHVEQRETVSTWHPDVKYYELYNADGSLRGGMYVDLYAREHKRGGAWMDDCVSYRALADGSHQTPVAFLTCNFAPPTKGEQAYFSHDEVLTLFHEFGHCLHHLLTKVPYLAASGINGVEWDAVELPSQFFENWCWHKEALDLLTEHQQTHEKLPQDLFDKLLRSKNFQAAMAMLRQIEFSLFDFTIHQNYSPTSPADVLTTLRKIRQQYSVLPYPETNRFPHGFSHIFGGGYAAGYYSYKWAEVLSSDAFERFEQEGIFNQACGRAFMKEILERGSSRKALDSFIAFRGREPKIDALLKHCGIHS